MSIFPFVMEESYPSNVFGVGDYMTNNPAGIHGFNGVQNGHFYFQDGTRARFYGVNLSFGSNFKTHENTDEMVQKLKKAGFNAIRVHHIDTSPGNYSMLKYETIEGQQTTVINTDYIDNWDYLIYKCKQNGIYVDLNLYVGRPYKVGDGVNTYKFPQDKAANIFDDELIAQQKWYASQLLGRYNQYTELVNSNDPVFAMIEILNETSLLNYFSQNWIRIVSDASADSNGYIMHQEFVNKLITKWNEWLTNKYINSTALTDAWTPIIGYNVPNIVLNSDFSGGTTSWNFKDGDATASNSVISGEYNINTIAISSKPWDVQLFQYNLPFIKGQFYEVSFDAYSPELSRINVNILRNGGAYENIGYTSGVITLTAIKTTYTIMFRPNNTLTNAMITFDCGYDVGNVYIDNVIIKTPSSVPPLDIDESYGDVNFVEYSKISRYPEERIFDMIRFIIDISQSYYNDMINYLHGIGVVVPITTSQLVPVPTSLLEQETGDYIDYHGYYDHPQFPNSPWNIRDFTMDNIPSTRRNPATDYTISSYFGKANIDGKPLTLTEINCPYPHIYQYEAPLNWIAYACFQDFDAIFHFAWSHYETMATEPRWFNMEADPVMYLTGSVNAFIFRNFLIQSGLEENKQVIPYNRNDMIEVGLYDLSTNLVYSEDETDIPQHLNTIHKVRKSFSDSDVEQDWLDIYNYANSILPTSLKKYESDTGEITHDLSTTSYEYLQVNAPKVQGITGFITDKKYILDNLEIEVEQPCSVCIIPADLKDIGESETLILTVAGQQLMYGQIRDPDTGNIPMAPTGPMFMDQTTGTIKILISNSEEYDVYAIQPDGIKFKDKTNDVVYSVDGLTITLKNNDNSIMYLITMREGLKMLLQNNFVDILKENQNLIKHIPLGVDSNSNGVSDGWSSALDSGITATFSIDNNVQKIEITNSTSTNNAKLSSVVYCNPGNLVQLKCNYKVSGNIKGRTWIEWYNASDVFLSSSAVIDGSAADYTLLQNNVLAPASTSYGRIRFAAKPNNIGDVGSVWFKDGSVII